MKEGYIVRMIGMIVAQVKNLRSQVGRAAVHVMAALFEQVAIIIDATNNSPTNDCPKHPAEAQHGVRPGEDCLAAGAQDGGDESVPEGGLQHCARPDGGERVQQQGDRHRDERADHEQEPGDQDNSLQNPCLHHRQVSVLQILV